MSGENREYNNPDQRTHTTIEWLAELLKKILNPSPIEANKEVAPEQIQKLAKERIMKNLEKRGLLATAEENTQLYQELFGFSAFHPPEAFLSLPGGTVNLDKKTGRQFKAYFNPALSQFREDYQLVAVIEEAIHLYQYLKHKITPERFLQAIQNPDADEEFLKLIQEMEIESKEKILKMASHYKFSKDRINYLQTELGRAKLGVRILNQSL